jgi:hypothetical protein
MALRHSGNLIFNFHSNPRIHEGRVVTIQKTLYILYLFNTFHFISMNTMYTLTHVLSSIWNMLYIWLTYVVSSIWKTDLMENIPLRTTQSKKNTKCAVKLKTKPFSSMWNTLYIPLTCVLFYQQWTPCIHHSTSSCKSEFVPTKERNIYSKRGPSRVSS